LLNKKYEHVKKKLVVEVQIAKKDISHFQAKARLNFPPSFFPRGLLNRQSANLMEYLYSGLSLLRT